MNASLLENESGIGDAKQYLSPIDKMIKMDSLEKTNPVMADLVKKGVLPLEDVPLQQISPFGKTVGDMTYPVTDEELDIFSGGDPDAYLKSLKDNVAATNDAVSVELPKGRSQTYDEWLDKYKSNEDLSGSGNLIKDVGEGMGDNMRDLMEITTNIQGGYGNADENFTRDQLIAGMNAKQPYNNPLLDAKGATPDVPPSAFGKFPMQFATNAGQMENRNTSLLNDNRVKTGFSGKTAADIGKTADDIKYDQVKDEFQKKLGFAESAALKMGSQVVPWINQGLTAEGATALSNMDKAAVKALEKTQGYDKNFKPKVGQKAVSGTKYALQGAGSLVGQNRVPFGTPFNTSVAGGTAATQKLLQNPTLKALTSNPYLRRAALGAGLLGTGGMVLGAFDAGKGVANYAIDKLGVRDDLKGVGANIAASVQARKVAAENIKKEKDAGTFKPRVTTPAKKAAVEKKVVKKAAPKRVTVKYNQNRPVAVKSKPTRTPAPKVTRTTGSRGGRGNVAKKKATKKYTSKGGW